MDFSIVKILSIYERRLKIKKALFIKIKKALFIKIKKALFIKIKKALFIKIKKALFINDLQPELNDQNLGLYIS